MNTLKMIVLANVVLAATPLLADVKYRAGYEINFGDGGKSGWSIQTRSWLSAEEPVIHEFGKYEVSILLGDVSGTACSVVITVKESRAPALESALLRHSFDVSFTGQSEFSAEHSPISIDGVIAVNRLEN